MCRQGIHLSLGGEARGRFPGFISSPYSTRTIPLALMMVAKSLAHPDTRIVKHH
jgi:hypothetical protein